MGITKTDGFSDQLNQQASILKALGHPARLAIIEHLLQHKQCICGELVLELPLSQPTISQHLNELKKVQLIQGTIEGKTVCYCINASVINQISELFKCFAEGCLIDFEKKCC
jgi:DNA-binding transcriptional ArsR family regulator